MASNVEGTQELRRGWGWLMALGIVMILLGIFALSAYLLVTLLSVIYFGIVLLVGGVFQVGHALWARRWGGVLLQLLIGLLEVIVGLLCITHPIQSAADLTLLIAAFFLVSGLFRLCALVVHSYPQWGWALLSGVINVLLGALIWAQWPESAFWVIGTFVGIDLLFAGWSYVMIALAARSLPGPTV
jgi:uncharacterized membrane protein HdeD (DUF308 family)